MASIFSRISNRTVIPAALLLGFTILLISHSLLSLPVSPSKKQQIGWQAWDVVQYDPSAGTEQPLAIVSGNQTDEGDGLDEEWDGDGHSPSLPLDNWVSIIRLCFAWASMLK
jgi:hypothetical protein